MNNLVILILNNNKINENLNGDNFYFVKIFAFVQSCTAFYHEGYEKHFDCETKYSKSQGGIQALSNNFEYFKTKSKELITDILKVEILILHFILLLNSLFKILNPK
jgi:hypothetical protein